MADKIKISVVGTCPGGEHLTVSVKRNGGGVSFTAVVLVSDLVSDSAITNEDLSAILPILLKDAVKSVGAGNGKQAKTAIEATEWNL